MSKLSAVLLLGVAVIVAHGDWLTIRQLTFGPTNSNLPTIGRGALVQGDGIHVVYTVEVEDVWRVFYLRSTDRGENWSEPAVLGDSVEGFAFSLAATGTSNLHLIIRRFGNRLCYRRSTDAGATWQQPVELGYRTENPLLLTDGQDHVYIIDPAAGLTDAVLYVRRSVDNGLTWQAPVYIAWQGGFGGLCATATRDGRIHIAWGHGQSGESQVFHVRSTDRGATWGSVQQVSSQSRVAPFGIWTGAGQHLLLAFTRAQNGRNFRRSSDAGATWSAETTLAVVLGDCAVDTFGGVHCLGTKDENRVLYLRTASQGAAWTDTVRISGPGDAVQTKPHLGFDSRADLYAVWNGRDDSARVQVYLRRGEGIGGIEDERDAWPSPEVHLRPNPAGATVWLDGAGNARLFDRLGAEVEVLRSGPNPVGHLPAGVYFALPEGSSTGRPVRLVTTGR